MGLIGKMENEDGIGTGTEMMRKGGGEYRNGVMVVTMCDSF